MLNIKRGEIYFADLSPGVGSEQIGRRPVLIIQNNVGNNFAPTIIAASITSQVFKAKIPTHVEINDPSSGLEKNSVVLLEQLRTLDKARLEKYVGSLSRTDMLRVDEGLKISLGLI